MIQSAGDSPPKIIPLHSYDDTLSMQTLVCLILFVFDTPLDPEKLRNAFCTLAEKPGWERIGARLKRRWDGRLEYHIPSRYTSVQPAIMFSQEQHDMDMKDHPEACHIPQPTEQPSVVADVATFSSIVYPPNAPKTVLGYVGADIAQLALHVIVFRDATTLAFSYPHTYTDGMGFVQLLRALLLVLQDPTVIIPPPLGVDYDPLAPLGRNPTQSYQWRDQYLSDWQKLKHLGWNLPGWLLHPRALRIVCIPSSFITSLHEEALRDLSNANNGKTIFVTESDVLFAWWARLIFSYDTRNMGQTLNLISTVSWRKALSQDLLPAGCVYLSNSIGFLTTMLSKKDLLQEPIGCTAYRIRQSILEGNTREQIEAEQALSGKSRFGFPTLLGSSVKQALVVTNLKKINFSDLDFSSATLSPQRSTAKPYYTQACFYDGPHQILGPLCTFNGKDANGNFWIFCSLEKCLWSHIEATLSKIRSRADIVE